MIPAQRNTRGWSYIPGSSIIRGYDTSQLFREDCLERIRHLQAKIDSSLKQMAHLKKEHAATQERLSELKKEFGLID